MIGHLLFSPLIPWPFLAILSVLGILLLGIRGVWRLIPLAALVLVLANPRLTKERATPLNDVAVVMVDDSRSMTVGDRPQQRDHALANVLTRLARLSNLEVKVEHIRDGRNRGTNAFEALNRVLADVPRSRLAGVVMITDGQIADVPSPPDPLIPVHVLLAGHKNDRDRRLVIEQAPTFGIVGRSVTLSFHVEDPGYSGNVPVTLIRDGQESAAVSVPLNHSTHVDVPVEHAGSNIVELQVASAANELTLANNRAAISIGGVRDRLRVLLVSGEPHAGERTWRNLLKADPAVDLVHFTILRPPEKEDRTPLAELALITFPVRELFERKNCTISIW